MDTPNTPSDAIVLSETTEVVDETTGLVTETVEQRLGTITLNPDIELIERMANKGIWHDSKIVKEQANVAGQELNYAVRIVDADGKKHLCTPKGRLLSEDYLMIHNTEIIEMAHAVAQRTGHDFTPTRLSFDGKRFEYYLSSPGFVNRVGDLRQIERDNHTFLRRDGMDENGDYVRLGLRAINTYDGSTKARVEAFVERLICLNGALLRDELFSFTFEHKVSTNGNRPSWEGELDRAGYELRNLHTRFDQFCGQLAQLRNTRISMSKLTEFSQALPKNFPMQVYGQLVRRFLDHEEPTAFGLYNAATYITWHNGDKLTPSDVKRNEDLVELIATPKGIYLN